MNRHLGYFCTTLVLAATLALAACDSVIYDDLKDCPQELVFHFYRQTPRETQPYYPREIREVRVFVFDQNDVLTQQFSTTDLVLTRDYFLTVPFDQQGDFTFVAWGAEDFSDYELPATRSGEVTRKQLELALNHSAGSVDKRPAPLFFGEVTTPVSRHYEENEGTHRDTVSINLLELTNRINLSVYGLKTGDTYTTYITDDNDRYTFGGKIVEGRAAFDYNSPQDANGSVLRSRFTTLKLEEERATRLVIYDETTDSEVFSARLVDDLLMYRGIFGEPPYSLEDDHDFNIVVVLEREIITGTYMAVRITVNDWNVVKRTVTPH